MDIHTIINDPVNGWQWARSCPLEAAGQKPGDFLGSYLEKSMSAKHGSMYWATGIKSWTCSDSLRPQISSDQKDRPLRSPAKGYVFKGVSSPFTGFRTSKLGQAISLFSGKMRNLKTQTISEKPIEKQVSVKESSFKTASQITKDYIKFSRGV